VALLALVLSTFRDYGVSWDEYVHVQNGEHLLRYYSSGFSDRSYAGFENLYLYGGFFDLLQTLASRPLVRALGLYESRHLVNALFALVGVSATWMLARLLAGPRAALFAALLLWLMPTWQGHAFNNPKDVPFAVMYALSLWALVRLGRLGGRAPLRLVLVGGLLLGLTLATRVGGLLPIGLLLLAAAWRAVTALGAGDLREAALDVAKSALAAATAWGTALAFWPWLLEAPIEHLLTALRAADRFPWSQPVLYLGRQLFSTELPWHYLPVWLAIQTPLLVLVLLLAGLVLGAARLAGARRPPDAGLLLVLASVLVPLAIVLLGHPVLYDAARHFLFLLPPLAVLAALSAEALIDRLTRVRPPWRLWLLGLAAAAGLALGSLPVAEMLRLHPYEYVYFNGLVGGLRGASGRFELDYWGHSLREATLGLLAWERRAAVRPGRAWRVFICGPPVSASYFFPPGFTRVRTPQGADFAIVLRRPPCTRPYRRLTPIVTVEREGVPLSHVYRLADGEPETSAEDQEVP
jgi:hypothetical protein